MEGNSFPAAPNILKLWFIAVFKTIRQLKAQFFENTGHLNLNENFLQEWLFIIYIYIIYYKLS